MIAKTTSTTTTGHTDDFECSLCKDETFVLASDKCWSKTGLLNIQGCNDYSYSLNVTPALTN